MASYYSHPPRDKTDKVGQGKMEAESIEQLLGDYRIVNVSLEVEYKPEVEFWVKIVNKF